MGSGPHHVTEWLVSAPSRGLDEVAFLDGFAEQVRRAGIPISRFASSVRNMHPEVFVLTMRWTSAEGGFVAEIPHSITATPDFVHSPVEAILQGSGPIRVRTTPGTPPPYPQLVSLQAGGMTDYLIVPLDFDGGRRTFASFATHDPAGFSDEQVGQLEGIAQPLSLRLDLSSTRYATRSLLRVYLGDQAAARVLSGQFRRGTGEELQAAIAFFDMRGFSTFSDTAPMRQVVETLDAYFEALAGPIAAGGGEILKFIGDAVLAVFPTGADAGAACRAAVSAARAGIGAVEALGQTLAAGGGPAVRAGAGVHVGRVLYGNVGARQRLDFTVIGPAVNEASRIESLCKTLGETVLVSQDCAALLGEQGLRSVGRHVLRGIREPKELFAPR